MEILLEIDRALFVVGLIGLVVGLTLIAVNLWLLWRDR